ncbi:MAG: sigma-54 dependent transcriptional regulator [Proteobacteria bacterium]|nr:sigma-54 dependent transcriptional regulator [Pseudomonadota bacterium]
MFEALIGQSPNFEAMLRSAKMVAATDVTVLIRGETGTGKELLAKALQNQGPLAKRPFITLNCAALPEALVESELFGHRRGAFTGAVANQTGRLQAADGGTLFMDEVDSLPLPVQAKLLRFLETGDIQPVGDTFSQRVNVRIIAATNTNLEERIANGEFRKDLYYRLNVVPIEIPPLRERMGDIQLLLNHFLRQFAAAHKLPAPTLSNRAIARLLEHGWPGNVRELRNVCERLCILLAGHHIEVENLPEEIIKPPVAGGGFILPEEGVELEQMEIDLILQALERTQGNRSHTARLLGITRDTLMYRMQKYNLR